MRETQSYEGPHLVDLHVGRRVCERRLSLGYNQTDLGRALGLTFQQVQKYEKGTNRISASKLYDTARFLDVEIGYFFHGLPGVSQRAADSSYAGGSVKAMPNRTSLEIDRLVTGLSAAQQKLVLGLVQALVPPVLEPTGVRVLDKLTPAVAHEPVSESSV